MLRPARRSEEWKAATAHQVEIRRYTDVFRIVAIESLSRSSLLSVVVQSCGSLIAYPPGPVWSWSDRVRGIREQVRVGRCASEMKWRLGPLGHAIMIRLSEHLSVVSQGKLGWAFVSEVLVSWAFRTGSQSASTFRGQAVKSREATAGSSKGARSDTNGCQAEERPKL